MRHVYGAAYASKCCLWLHINELNPLLLLWQKKSYSEMAIFLDFSDGYDAIYEKIIGTHFSQRRWWFQDFWFLQIAKTVIVSNMKKKCHCRFFLNNRKRGFCIGCTVNIWRDSEASKSPIAQWRHKIGKMGWRRLWMTPK